MFGRNLRDVPWVKSTRSAGNGQCVEVARLEDCVALRDSKDAEGPILQFSTKSWQSFVDSLRMKVHN
ncbi:DUF397 domain-containing protein [Phytohabitans aurantiacus]|uniref:DUF397 domain-containing protein n=1 Tax=Phytohabitans aurantiacus TaxID=3016789 RepID=UPI0024916BCE|nr:DUF397 domain-containing protein [Phytohabitans aurantiacus]